MPRFDKITINSLVMGGKPYIQDMRITSDMIVGQLVTDASISQVLSDYPYLERYLSSFAICGVAF